jgi:hypothetical protein
MFCKVDRAEFFSKIPKHGEKVSDKFGRTNSVNRRESDISVICGVRPKSNVRGRKKQCYNNFGHVTRRLNAFSVGLTAGRGA